MSTPGWITSLGLEDPSTSEYIHRPDLRQIATFFLGILFATSVYYFVHSPALASIISRVFRRKPSTNIESGFSDAESKSSSTSTSTQLDPLALVFILNVVYITTAATQFASLLAFSSSKGAVPCTFLVAWASLGTETVRLIGLLKLSFHLRELRHSNWERITLWGAMSMLAVVMFLSTAVATGVLRQIPQNQSLSLCYIRHFTLGAGVMAGMNLLLELYILGRFVCLLLPWLFGLDKNVRISRDVRIHRALSLIILDAATVYPSLFPTSLLADFAPFSVASVLVLMTFNHNPAQKQSITSTILQSTPTSLPQSIRIPTPNFSPFLNMNSSVSSLKERSIVEIPPEEGSNGSIRTDQQAREYRHPFANIFATENDTTDGRPHSLPVGHSTSLTEATRRTNHANGTPLGSFNGNGVQRRVTAYEVLLRGNEGSSQHSFLPVLATPSQSPITENLPQKPNRVRVRNPRQILPRQTEVADQMIADSRPFQPLHRTVPSSGSANPQPEGSTTVSPPAPPRHQRPTRQAGLPILVHVQDNQQSLTARSSSPDSTKVFGSDILIGSREDVMRKPKPHHQRDSREEEQVNASQDILDRERAPSRSSLSVNRPGSSHHSVATGDHQRPRTGESARPTTGDSVQTRGDLESLAIVHEGVPSSLLSLTPGEASSSKAESNAWKRPTFGEGSFERFKSGLAALTEIARSPRVRVTDLQSPSSPDSPDSPESRRRTSSGSGIRLGTRTRSGSKADKSREQSEKGSGS